MTVEELENIIRHSEVSRVQFKERIADNYSIVAEMVTFSNSRGGSLIIGVKDKTGENNLLTYEELQDTNQKYVKVKK